MDYLNKMVNNFDKNKQTFNNGDKVRLSTISDEWDEVKYAKLKDNVEYIISTNYY